MLSGSSVAAASYDPIFYHPTSSSSSMPVFPSTTCRWPDSSSTLRCCRTKAVDRTAQRHWIAETSKGQPTYCRPADVQPTYQSSSVSTVLVMKRPVIVQLRIDAERRLLPSTIAESRNDDYSIVLNVVHATIVTTPEAADERQKRRSAVAFRDSCFLVHLDETAL